ncbi:hypothetical protein [Brachyspira hyodysenteriae]|uniref:hypothetical protein n=1 Tax=Brachyspira hyodysenteriae TaxID=159 RepID=UPI00063D87CD|nr:hypothetical protein [Brachyspira hyodysenteriae]KLI46140.1 hypothetical protein SZ41_12290 [Brachyspira hyodysenteriae]KLI53619.1 hypothetical protein SZ42_00575 [Brachyspira hyodysenteriae]
MKTTKDYKNISLNLTKKEIDFIDSKRKTPYNTSFASFCLALIREGLEARYKDEYKNYIIEDNSIEDIKKVL